MFDDIRPYRDDEVVAVIKKLINQTGLQASIASLKMPRLYQALPQLACKIVKWSLKFRVKKFHNIEQIQIEVAKYLHHLIKNSTAGFNYSGLENFDTTKPALFISNHRDIVLDVALVNLALYKSGINTVEAAVGDNLLHQPWVADLMRINKSFIVKRNEENKRAMLNASKQLSAYIHDTVANRKQNIWIAQREGRAKDGVDKTNSALISMLLLNKDKQMPMADYLAELNIVPVSISYEFDPCDIDKAIELAEKAATGSYQKHEDEDLKSITQGLVGQKGQVHLQFCQPIQGDFANSKAIAAAIDKEIISNYKLYDSNLVAYAKLNQQDTDSTVLEKLNKRMENLTAEQQHWLLTMYANPVSAKQQLPL
ncbi:1-acyl-sn-glycerol-3-phosphate acyltransferase [Colwellia sp. MB02u-18]|uniref:1-acyl-sn-glycerol-3-phosphate acyltransferase n=1 Tax=unclassified Colwellia TaxID=196834 RepID=UPI0015F6599E|nr:MULTISPECIES: 1-acyl-sn-glycerol-3-phosphate acyltransferase [unclassified Colwellia]MBA6224249.1 1-acyl-sn-glycerol-3-phosphate acyltransferase [Colwellia sp. MB3u-45]MBA6265917.1 1-acyl-sn-glycerol-3-phosphate acyltransferase [Colwellia sp. MB3u-43]MBA6322669.1 1-acyl-sn-glycerol-3-phosphate acyltransferase [Colwellia sp. MB02u-19]MBA6323580.1 1-acyl-sn-glycerol-3-phosphate acyltransferase [Colwellia sp. MB02u-18]MBA6332812.1 1-acyl-sn-glycerol-3-phosphate acyltransferase [Colwellia sp. M